MERRTNTTGAIRQLRPSDLAAFREHLLRLDADSRRDRFNGVTDEVFLASYAARSFSEGATVIGYVEDGETVGLIDLSGVRMSVVTELPDGPVVRAAI